ncbi:MAG: carboxylesterase family protein [Solobacterium sp.]|nr:carboxylesterase family protein [Solobacterium sp.]
MEERIFRCKAGSFTGYETERCIHISGIRYAESERFTAPKPYRYGEGVHACTSPAPFCFQRRSRLEQSLSGLSYETRAQEESCQYLSITMPKEAKGPLPVMVWFHGGSYRSGGCDSPVYDRELLASEQNVMVIGVNYRLGVFGFVKDREGHFFNGGLLDAIEAVRWVKENCAVFGGDPDSITVFGQSAGADLVRSLLLSDGTEGLFRRAIIMSAPFGAMENRQEMELRVLAELNTYPMDAPAEKLKQAEEAILSHVVEKGNPKYLVFAPHYGIDPLPKRSEIPERIKERAGNTDLLIGCTSREVSVYGSDKRWFQVIDQLVPAKQVTEYLIRKMSDSIFADGSREFARMWSEAGGVTYYYTFEWIENHSVIGAGHTIDLLPLFGGKQAEGRVNAMGLTAEEIEEKGKPMRNVWAEFARSGMVHETEVKDLLKIQPYGGSGK